MIGSQLFHRAESQSHRPIKIKDLWQQEFIPSLAVVYLKRLQQMLYLLQTVTNVLPQMIQQNKLQKLMSDDLFTSV